MKTTKKNVWGSYTEKPLTINDRINLKHYLRYFIGLHHWSSFASCYAFRSYNGIEWSVNGVGSGLLNDNVNLFDVIKQKQY